MFDRYSSSTAYLNDTAISRSGSSSVKLFEQCYTDAKSDKPQSPALTTSPTITTPEDPLPELFAATAAGNRQAFARLYQLTSGRLLAVALRIVKQRELAEEILQDAYITIWNKSHQQTQRESPFAWMATIVRHRAIDRLRTLRNPTNATLELDDETLARLELNTASDETLEHLADGIRDCLYGLKAGPRQAILLAFFYGMAHGEIAAELDTPLGTVKSWVRRGLLQLKDCIEL